MKASPRPVLAVLAVVASVFLIPAAAALAGSPFTSAGLKAGLLASYTRAPARCAVPATSRHKAGRRPQLIARFAA